MQIQNNYSYRPNFGMAMKIAPGAAKALKKASIETIEELRAIGEDLKDTKHWNLEIDENLTPRLNASCMCAYQAPFSLSKPNFETLTVRAKWAAPNAYNPCPELGNDSKFFMNYSSREEAVKAYEKISSMSEHKQAAEFVKCLDVEAQKSLANAAVKKAKQDELEKAADALIKDFSW